MSELTTILAAMLGGILPALAWLWFWRREDSVHPEPRKLIALAFFAGMLTVAAVIPVQKFAAAYLQSSSDLFIGMFAVNTVIFTVWSIIEEVFKLIAASLTVLRRREDDEPVDPVIYMVTVALGFAAAENALFLLNPSLSGSGFLSVVQTGNLRFVGATLLHVLSSAVIGSMIGLAFYKKRAARFKYLVVGLILACILHAGFNFLILNTPSELLFRVFAVVWIGVIVLLAVLEYIKRLRPRWR